MYNTDAQNFATGLLPFSLRGSVKELLKVLASPFAVLYENFREFRKGTLHSLSYNACVGSMQAMLNDFCSGELGNLLPERPILVDEGEAVPSVMVYPEAEWKPLMVGWVILTSHRTWGAVPFVVRIPSELSPSAHYQNAANLYNKVERLVQQYKMAGTRYTIEYY